MNFRQMSDGIALHHRGDGYDDDGSGPNWLDASHSAPFAPNDAAAEHTRGYVDPHQPSAVQVDQHATDGSGDGGNGSATSAASGSSLDSGSLDPILVNSGANESGNGGSGYFYGGIIHASLAIYEPINITIAAGYGSSAEANQTNNVSIDQSAFQMAGVGGNGGNSNAALGGNVDTASSGSGAITTGDNSAGNGGDGHFSGMLIDSPVVIYEPINIAVAGLGGTAQASQSNTVSIDQSAVQIAGVGGNGGNGNAAGGGSVSALGSGLGSGGGIDTGGNEAGNGGDGSFHGSLVHTSVVVYDPVNIAVAGYNSSAYAFQSNNVHLDQSTFQMAGVGGNGGNDNAAVGGHASLLSSGLWGGTDAISTGSNSAGNGGNGYFAGSLVDVSVAIYAPINIAVAGPHSTAEANQINNVHIDQSAVQIAGIGGDGGNGNLALGGDLAMHLLSDLHLIG